MIEIEDLPLLGLMIFILVYSTVGDPESPTWSGLYFIAINITMLVLFSGHRTKIIRLIGISLSISVLIFVFVKYFTDYKIERWFTFIPFFICLIGICALEVRKNNGKYNRRKIPQSWYVWLISCWNSYKLW